MHLLETVISNASADSGAATSTWLDGRVNTSYFAQQLHIVSENLLCPCIFLGDFGDHIKLLLVLALGISVQVLILPEHDRLHLLE